MGFCVHVERQGQLSKRQPFSMRTSSWWNVGSRRRGSDRTWAKSFHPVVNITAIRRGVVGQPVVRRRRPPMPHALPSGVKYLRGVRMCVWSQALRPAGLLAETARRAAVATGKSSRWGLAPARPSSRVAESVYESQPYHLCPMAGALLLLHQLTPYARHDAHVDVAVWTENRRSPVGRTSPGATTFSKRRLVSR